MILLSQFITLQVQYEEFSTFKYSRNPKNIIRVSRNISFSVMLNMIISDITDYVSFYSHYQPDSPVMPLLYE